MKLSHLLRADGYAPDFIAGLSVSGDVNSIRIWDSPTKANEIIASTSTRVGDQWLLAEMPEFVYVEGLTSGVASLTLAVVGRDTSMFTGMVFAGATANADDTTAVINVFGVDLDIWKRPEYRSLCSRAALSEKTAITGIP